MYLSVLKTNEKYQTNKRGGHLAIFEVIGASPEYPELTPGCFVIGFRRPVDHMPSGQLCAVIAADRIFAGSICPVDLATIEVGGHLIQRDEIADCFLLCGIAQGFVINKSSRTLDQKNNPPQPSPLRLDEKIEP
jgi:hypothetical protein